MRRPQPPWPKASALRAGPRPSAGRRRLWLLLAAPALAWAQGAPREAQTLDLRLALVDADGRPLAGLPLRAVLALGDGWQAADAGARLVTDAGGVARWTLNAAPEPRRRKLPTNFFTQAVSLPQPTAHVAVAVELAYLGRPWLVVAAADRFADGTTAQLDGLQVYGRDETGRFSLPAAHRDGAWFLPGVPGALTVPGFAVLQFVLSPGAGGWTVDLTLQRLAEPVRR